jgi:hypothetical protein
MIKKLWGFIVVHNYVKCGLRYGIDQESSWQVGDSENRYYIKTFAFWSKLYHKIGYRCISDDIWASCTYDISRYKPFFKIKRF